MTGVLTLIVAILTGVSLKEPQRVAIGEMDNKQQRGEKVNLVKALLQPKIVMLALTASIRHCGGLTFAYNADLYFNGTTGVHLPSYIYAVVVE